MATGSAPSAGGTTCTQRSRREKRETSPAQHTNANQGRIASSFIKITLRRGNFPVKKTCSKCQKLCFESSTAEVPKRLIEVHVSPETARRYLKFDVDGFVESNKSIRWCPAPGCQRAVSLPAQSILHAAAHTQVRTSVMNKGKLDQKTTIFASESAV